MRLVPIAARSTRLVAAAAPRDLARTLLSEVVVAVSLAAVLIFGREVVVRLTEDQGSSDISATLGPVLGLGAAMVISAVAQVVSQETRGLVSTLTVQRIQEEIVDVATSVEY